MTLKEKMLSASRVYNSLQSGLTRSNTAKWLYQDFVGVQETHKVLDIGCGTGAALRHIHPSIYLGLDHNKNYIRKAEAQYGARGTFRVLDIDQIDTQLVRTFDVILLIGVLHHISDGLAQKLLAVLSSAMRSDAYAYSIDPVFSPGQSSLSRMAVKLDRGRHVRSADSYRQLVSPFLDITQAETTGTLLRIPYEHILFKMIAKRS